MSASLVGSEMCIRDRTATVQELLRCLRDVGIAVCFAVLGQAETDGMRAVSYTHLTLPTICSV
eukprot:1932872-Alexandrium_andersonii.AAC.1